MVRIKQKELSKLQAAETVLEHARRSSNFSSM